jgi:hypothetical protein
MFALSSIIFEEKSLIVRLGFSFISEAVDTGMML